MNAWERKQLSEIEDRLETEDPVLAGLLGDQADHPPGDPPGERPGREWGWAATAALAAGLVLSAISLGAGAYLWMLLFGTVVTVAASVLLVYCRPFLAHTFSPNRSRRPRRGQGGGRRPRQPRGNLHDGYPSEGWWWAPWLVYPDLMYRDADRRKGEESR